MILELGRISLEWIQVTAAYSNAVLVAVLPHISDVAQKLDLPVSKPVRIEDVFHCNIMPNRRVEAEIGIKGGWFFQFSFGFVKVIQGPHEFFTMQDPDKIPEFYGEVRMSKSEAISLARNTLRKLDIPLEAVFAEQEPRVTEPVKIGTNTVPHYRIEWLDPRAGGAAVDMDIDANVCRVERIAFSPSNLQRPPPKINVVPPRDTRFRPVHLTNPDYAMRLIPIAFRAIDEYGKKLSLPLPCPLTTNEVAKFSLADNGGWPHCEIELTNGWRFIYRNSMVNGYYAPDNFFNSSVRPITIKEFTGSWNLTEQAAIELVKKTISKMNYPTNLVHMNFPPHVICPAGVFKKIIPRYLFEWDYFEHETDEDMQSKVEAEVDAGSGELKSLYFDDKTYWNHPPPIDVPISLPIPTSPGMQKKEIPKGPQTDSITQTNLYSTKSSPFRRKSNANENFSAIFGSEVKMPETEIEQSRRIILKKLRRRLAEELGIGCEDKLESFDLVQYQETAPAKTQQALQNTAGFKPPSYDAKNACEN